MALKTSAVVAARGTNQNYIPIKEYVKRFPKIDSRVDPLVRGWPPGQPHRVRQPLNLL
jgi:hypothetical protein